MGLLLPLVSDGRKCRKLNTDKKSDILLPKLHYLTEVDYVPKTGHLPEVDYRSEVNYEVPAGCPGASASTHVIAIAVRGTLYVTCESANRCVAAPGVEG